MPGMMRRTLLMLVGGVFLLCGVYGISSAGTTGKITGQVTDTQGSPLPGASVVIKGTRRGSEADGEGFFFLLSVEPGVHTLMASMVGYETREKTGVVVSSDFTTNASFELWW